ncbi:SfnB family sulfur acquisition oxidoreductase [Methylobacterium sp. WL103]|uniref:SfnB family sulfur acquisition oxidoreductase n=1 Tax=unclassified Methylobacterium TaxID=2615210 RepID=UPI0011CB107C|nr:MULTISPECIES: SfnB family sulfur acquisition oxidoreductase [unclassified Methylobacterium]TXM76705.1 SfnB family sulfur acquisition oxidoreductase [Methylobacterium sp. WL12]TXM90405.1 SfnB family sulfur acquisition oxidoreductase [Methylobacterium sp. WL103]
MNIAVDTRSLAGTAPAQGAPGPVRPAEPAHVIRDDAEAIRVAHDFAASIRAGASERDLAHARPLAELDRFSQSGLWSINVPSAHGGPEVSYRTLAQVVAIVAAADPSIAQIAQNHLGIVAAIRTVSDPDQQALLFAEVLRGTRFGNAFSEKGTPRAAEFATHFTDHGDHVIVQGQKFYATGALLAHLVPIVAVDDAGRAWYAIADRNAPGLTVIDDWSAFGQRGTASGTVLIENVRVEKSHLVPAWKAYQELPRLDGAIFQIIQAAIDAGIGRAALDDTIAFVREKARPWIDADQARASDDPYTIQAVGDLTIRLHAAEAILDRAGLAIDAALPDHDAALVDAAKIAVAESKVLTTEIALAASNKLFELAGTRSTLAEHNLDRHWRNARTHTLHDPVRWKVAIVGNHALNGVAPPSHAWS